MPMQLIARRDSMELTAQAAAEVTPPTGRWWSMGDASRGSRTDAWEAALESNYRRWQVPERVDEHFDARIRSRNIAGLNLVECICDPCHGRRVPKHVSAENAIYIGVQITKSGRECFRSGEDSLIVAAGDLVIWTSDRPTEFTVTERLHKVSLVLPWSEIQERLPRVRNFRGTVLDSRAGIGAVLYSHIESLATQLDVLAAGDLSAVRRATLELLTAAMAYRLEAPAIGLSRQYLKRIQDYILDHLQDERLSPGSIAEAHHISPRYLHLLFAQTDQSVSSHIRQQRLERCREALESPAFRTRGVAEIAYQWGFADPAHFSRIFKRQFGRAPSDLRH